MASEARPWDLLTDGWLWREAASAVDDPEFLKQCVIMVGRLQGTFDRADGVQLVAADSAAAAIVRKWLMVRYLAAHTKIAAYHAKQDVEKADPSVRDAARIAATLPSDHVLDRSIKLEGFSDRQFQKYLALMDRPPKRTAEQVSDVSRKPPQRVQAEEVNQRPQVELDVEEKD